VNTNCRFSLRRRIQWFAGCFCRTVLVKAAQYRRTPKRKRDGKRREGALCPFFLFQRFRAAAIEANVLPNVAARRFRRSRFGAEPPS
jgi:hypothetical protein